MLADRVSVGSRLPGVLFALNRRAIATQRVVDGAGLDDEEAAGGYGFGALREHSSLDHGRKSMKHKPAVDNVDFWNQLPKRCNRTKFVLHLNNVNKVINIELANICQDGKEREGRLQGFLE